MMTVKKLNQIIDSVQAVANTAWKEFENSSPDSQYHAISESLSGIKTELNKGEFYVLIGGEVKAGKSTLVNSLVGQKVCSVAQEVCTNVCTIIRYGDTPKFIVHYKADEEGIIPDSLTISEDQVSMYSTESLNPKNEKNVAYIEVQVNSSMLANGMVLIDTPGLGAIDPQHAFETFSMAKKADVILFLGSTGKQLTSVEIASLNSLIEVSQCERVAHVLTCCDQGDRNAIAAANEAELERLVPSLKIPVIPVSSLLFLKYLNNKKQAYLDKSGFKTLYAYLYTAGKEKERILCSVRGIEVSLQCNILLNALTSLEQASQDTTKFQERQEKLRNAISRLENLRTNRNTWYDLFAKEIRKLNNNLRVFSLDQEKKSIEKLESKLNEDVYLKDATALTNAVQAILSSSLTDLEDFIKEGLEKAFTNVRNDSGFSDISQEIYCWEIEKVQLPNLEIKDEGLSTKLERVGRKSLYGFGIGSLVTYAGTSAFASSIGLTALMAKIGTAAGSIVPGLGNLIGGLGGALLGGLIGFFSGLFESKNHKRKRILKECAPKIHEYYQKASLKADNCLADSSTMLKLEFLNLINAQIKACEAQITNLQDAIKAVHSHMATLRDMKATVTAAVIEIAKG